jgi:hypothetical protein
VISSRKEKPVLMNPLVISSMILGGLKRNTKEQCGKRFYPL